MPLVPTLSSCPRAAAPQLGFTPLHNASALGYDDCIEALLAMGADPGMRGTAQEMIGDVRARPWALCALLFKVMGRLCVSWGSGRQRIGSQKRP